MGRGNYVLSRDRSFLVKEIIVRNPVGSFVLLDSSGGNGDELCISHHVVPITYLIQSKPGRWHTITNMAVMWGKIMALQPSWHQATQWTQTMDEIFSTTTPISSRQFFSPWTLATPGVERKEEVTGRDGIRKKLELSATRTKLIHVGILWDCGRPDSSQRLSSYYQSTQ